MSDPRSRPASDLGGVAPGRAFAQGRVAVGHPVDVASGAFFQTYVDYAAPGAVPLVLARRYSTADLEPPALTVLSSEATPIFGPGTRPSFAPELRRTLEGFVLLRENGDGATIVVPRGQAVVPGARFFSPASGVELTIADGGRARVVGYGVDRDFVELWFDPTPAGAYRLAALARTPTARVDVDYDGRGRVVMLRQTRERRALLLAYDDDGRVSRVDAAYADGTSQLAAAYEYDHCGHLVVVRDHLGITFRYAYDASGRLTDEWTRRGAHHAVRYDREGRCVFVSADGGYQERRLRWDEGARRAYVTDSHGAVTHYEYDEDGQVTRSVLPSGLEHRTEYDDFRRIAAIYLPNGAAVQLRYDELGRTTAIVRADGRARLLRHDDLHRLIEYTEPSGAVVHIERNAVHEASRVILPDGTAWTYEFDDAGAPVRIVDPTGAQRVNTYDGLGRIVATTTWEGHVYEAAYDGLGRTIAIRDPLGGVTRYGYDDEDRLTVITFPDGRTHERSFDGTGTVVEYVTPDGRRARDRFSVCGPLVEHVDEASGVTLYEWDTEPGRLLRIVNAKGEVASFAYDADGNRVRFRAFDGREYRYAWRHGQLAATQHPNGVVTTYERDVLGRIVRRAAPEGDLELAYDASHKLVAATAAGTSLTFTYDVCGRLVHENQSGVELTRTYDAVRNVTSLRTSSGIALEYGYDRNGDCTALRYGGVPVTLSRNARGWEVERAVGNVRIEHSYDLVGRTIEQLAFGRRGSILVRRAYGYDAGGALASVDDSLRGTLHLWHDVRGELLAALRSQGSSDFFAWDAVGNVLARVAVEDGAAVVARAWSEAPTPPVVVAEAAGGAREDLAYAPGHRLVRVEGPERTIFYEHDPGGFVVAKHVRTGDGTHVYRFGWDSRGRLVRVTLPTGHIWEYRYDALGRRIEKRGPAGVHVRYVWDRYRILSELRPHDVSTFVHIPHEEGGPVLIDDGRLHAVVPDPLGAPSETISLEGDLEVAVTKSTWGEMPPGSVVRMPFVGQWRDEETGLHYNVFRYYDPDAGRYLSPDPIGFLGGLNEYAYVDDPFQIIDPWGLYDYEQLRRRSPTQAVRDSVNQGDGVKTCPALGTTHERLDADHIVSLKEITGMNGFQRLTDEDQLAIANFQENFIGLGPPANRSKQDKSWSEWEGHSELGPPDEKFRRRMQRRERELRRRIQDEIDRRQPRTEEGC